MKINKDNIFFDKLLEYIPALFAIVIAYAIFFVSGIGCPIKFVTGISCMGCGMTRAWISLLKLDFSSAFLFHPLVLLPIPCLFLFVFKSKISKRSFNIILGFIICAFILVYIFRIIDLSDDIVVFEPEDGLIYKMIRKLCF